MKRTLAFGLATIAAITVVGYVGSAAYTLHKIPLEMVVVCGMGDPGIRIPAFACNQYLAHFAERRSLEERNSALATAVGAMALGEASVRETGSAQVSMLLTQGADINALSVYDGYAPLHAAVLADQPELVRYLLQAGADAGTRDANRQQTPLEFAVWLETSKQLDRRAVREALEGRR